MNYELRSMSCEYWLDSSIQHVVNKKCNCIRPIMLERMKKARNDIRSIRDVLRNEQGYTQKTMTNPSTNTWGKEKKRGWGKGLKNVWDCDKEIVLYCHHCGRRLLR